MSASYEKYRGTALWQALTRALDDLERNRDIVVTTEREYVIGYLTSKLSRNLAGEKNGESKKAKRERKPTIR